MNDEPLIIHHIEGRRSERIAWLCEELGLPYELRFVSGDVGASAQALYQIHPMAMAPVLEHGALKMVESGAIIEYMLWKYGQGRLRPAPDAPAMADYLQWTHFAEGSGMFRPMMERLVLELAPNAVPPSVSFYIGGGKRVLTFAEAALAGRSYFAGDAFTAADIMMHFPLRLAPLALQGVIAVTPMFHDDRSGLGNYPNVDGFLIRMAARPAFQRAMARTTPNGPPPI